MFGLIVRFRNRFRPGLVDDLRGSFQPLRPNGRHFVGDMRWDATFQPPEVIQRLIKLSRQWCKFRAVEEMCPQTVEGSGGSTGLSLSGSPKCF